MKTEKLNLKSIKNVLSRNEMKKIMAGSGPVCSDGNQQCGGPSGQPCCGGLYCNGPLGGGSGICVACTDPSC
jgi:hypothetical protein